MTPCSQSFRKRRRRCVDLLHFQVVSSAKATSSRFELAVSAACPFNLAVVDLTVQNCSFCIINPRSSLFAPQTSAGNDFNEHTCCLFAPALLHTATLTEIELDKEPFACTRTLDWQKAGLAHLPDEVAHMEWVGVIKHLAKSSKVGALLRTITNLWSSQMF